jgi:hypothetical protein
MPQLNPQQLQNLASHLQSQYGMSASQAQSAANGVNSSYNSSSGRFNYNSNYNSSNSTAGMNAALSTLGNKLGNTIGMTLGRAENIFFGAFQEQSGGMGNRIGVATAKSMVDGITGAISSVASGDIFGAINQIIGTGGDLLTKLTTDMGTTNKQLYQVVDQSGAFVGNMAEIMRTETYGALALATSFGMSTEEFMSSIENLNKSSGRMVLYTKEALEAGVRASVGFTSSSKTLLENSESFRNVGLGIADVANKIEIAGKRTLELGMNAKVLGDTLVKNIGKLNEYGFRNGFEGLSKMAQEAQSLNFNMENTFKIASDLFDPNKALDMSANLAVIGGAVGDFGDPLRMIYDVTNNVEGLQSSLVKAAKGLATYNSEQQRFEVTGANLRRAKLMADTFGISMSELTNLAVKANVQFQSMREINLLNVTPDQKEFLKNISTMQDGKIGFYVPEDLRNQMGLDSKDMKNGFLSLQQFNALGTGIQAKLLKEQERISALKPEEIARGQYQKIDQITNILSAWYIQSQVAIRGNAMNTPLSKAMDEYAKQLSNSDPKSKEFGTQILNSLKIAQDKMVGASNPLHNTAPSASDVAQMEKLHATAPPRSQTLDSQKQQQTQSTPKESTVNIKQEVLLKSSMSTTDALNKHYSKNIHELKMLGLSTVEHVNSFDTTKKLVKK